MQVVADTCRVSTAAAIASKEGISFKVGGLHGTLASTHVVLWSVGAATVGSNCCCQRAMTT